MGAGLGRPCRCCSHPNRAEIDAQLVAASKPLRRIAHEFAVSERSLSRHASAHVSTSAQREAALAVISAESERGGTIAEQVADLHATAVRILRTAEAAGDLRTALSGVREASRCVELIAKLCGELDESATVNVVIAPAFITLQGAILDALAPYPDARIAVARALERVA